MRAANSVSPTSGPANGGLASHSGCSAPILLRESCDVECPHRFPVVPHEQPINTLKRVAEGLAGEWWSAFGGYLVPDLLDLARKVWVEGIVDGRHDFLNELPLDPAAPAPDDGWIRMGVCAENIRPAVADKAHEVWFSLGHPA